MMHRWQLPAPGDLDLVRTFLNTWALEIATRTPRDQLCRRRFLARAAWSRRQR